MPARMIQHQLSVASPDLRPMLALRRRARAERVATGY